MKLSYILILIALQYLSPLKAEAYVDFGTGSMIVQSIMAALIGGSVFFKDSLVRIFTGFRSKKNSKNTSD